MTAQSNKNRADGTEDPLTRFIDDTDCDFPMSNEFRAE